MTIDAARLLATTTRRQLAWQARDCIIYAHGIGLGTDQLDDAERAYFSDTGPRVFPTFPVSLALTGGPLATAGLDMRGVLHGAHALTLHASFPAEGLASMDGAIVGIWDKGIAKGAVFIEEKRLTAGDGGQPLATIRTTVFGRAEGGCGAPREGQPAPHTLPRRAPDDGIAISTAANQALLYRLSGDLNPIHFDPAIAVKAGFDRPILHGLCTFAICTRAVINRQAARNAARLRHIEARFSGPVYPGDELHVAIWRDGDVISFEAHVPAREAVVITAGKAIIASENWT